MMRNDFMESFLNEELDILENYQAVKDFFSQEIEEAVTEEYDVIEVLFSFLDDSVTRKEFEKIIDFRTVLKTKNKLLFQEVFPVYNNALTVYYGYHGMGEKLDELLDDCIEISSNSSSIILYGLKRASYYGRTEKVEKYIEKLYKEPNALHYLLEEEEEEFGRLKGWIELERQHANWLKGDRAAWDNYAEGMKKIGVNVQGEYVDMLARNFGKELVEIGKEYKKDILRNKGKAEEKLEWGFLQYMSGRKMPFAASGSILAYLNKFWKEGKEIKERQPYFELDAARFDEFLSELAVDMFDDKFVSVLVLWGSAYVYDYLKATELIGTRVYEHAKRVIRDIQQDIVKTDVTNFWEYEFVHTWEKSEMMTAQELDLEIEASKNSYLLIETPDNDLAEESASENQKKQADEMIPPHTPESAQVKPIKKEAPKLGRNEKVTVKYQDGTIKTDVKYKKVKDDIDSGKCTIIG